MIRTSQNLLLISGFVIRRSQVQILCPAPGWICLWWPRITHTQLFYRFLSNFEKINQFLLIVIDYRCQGRNATWNGKFTQCPNFRRKDNCERLTKILGSITSHCPGKEPALLPRTHGWTCGPWYC